MVEQWSQTVGARERRARVLLSRLVECDPRRRGVYQGAPRVVAETRLLDDRVGRPCPLVGLAPVSLFGCEKRELCLCHGDVVCEGADDQSADRPLLRDRLAHDRSRRAAHGQRRAQGARQGTSRSRVAADRAPDSRRRAPARPRAASCAPSGVRSTARSWCCRPTTGSSGSPLRRAQATARPRRPPGQHPDPRSVDGECRMLRQLGRHRTSRTTRRRCPDVRRNRRAEQERRPGRRRSPCRPPPARRRSLPRSGRWRYTMSLHDGIRSATTSASLRSSSSRSS